MLELTLHAVVIGLFATAAIDAWALLVKHGAGLPTTDWAMVGRWFGHLPRGKIIHRPIANSPEIRREPAIGWLAHYTIGVVYALLYMGTVAIRSGTPTISSAIVFGLLTLAAPWFILQPGVGAGMFARHMPNPNLIRGINISVHMIFGAALYIGWRLVTISLK